MTIKYIQPDRSASVLQDEASSILREANDFLESKGYNASTRGMLEELFSSSALYEEYSTKILEGLDADDEVQLKQILENNRMQILTGEGSETLMESISGIQPVASLTMPTIRKMWPRMALKNAIPTVPVKQPKFLISYMIPYILKEDGSRAELPQALRHNNNDHYNRPRLSEDPITLPANGFDLLTPVGATVAAGDAVDPAFSITSAKMKIKDAAGTATSVDVPLNALLSTSNTLYATVKANADDGTENKDVIVGSLDLRNGILHLASTGGTVESVKIQGFLSTENNTRSQSVSFDIANRDVTIGTGTHINAALPVEFLTDVAAMYSIDGTLETTELMSQVIAQKTDLQFIEYLDFSYERTGKQYEAEFDVMPSAQFANRPKEWREELKTVFDYMAEEMKQDTGFSHGEFVLIGNPIDMMLIPNTDWVFNHSADTRGGVNVDYSVGALSGANRYRLLSSPNVPRGSIRMIFVPSGDNQMTYKYFPYTFHVERGSYRDPMRPLLPGIMMTKRDKIDEFTPVIGKVFITNHNGKLPR